MTVPGHSLEAPGADIGLDVLLLKIGIGLPREDGLAGRKKAFRLVRDLEAERDIAKAAANGLRDALSVEQRLRYKAEDERDRLFDELEAVRRLVALQEDVPKLRAENERYRAALREIANEDYRGNRPWSATAAWRALNYDRR